MGVDVIGKKGDDETERKLHVTLVAMFILVAPVAMIFDTLSPTLPMQRSPKKRNHFSEDPV